MPKLDNARHEAFCRYVSKGSSLSAAYRRAGFADNGSNAARLVTENESVTHRINELKDAAARRAEVSEAFVLQNAKELLARCMQKTAVMERNDEGDLVATGEWKFDASGANKALDLIARHLGMFEHTRKVVHSGTVAVEQVDLTNLAPEKFEQLRAIVQEAQNTNKRD